MDVIGSIHEMQSLSDSLRQQGKRIAFVPTMGFLHDGHLSLMREAKKHADILVTSIFVNPAQFGPNEDLDAYPRAMESDLAKSRDAGVDVVFTPTSDQIYPEGYETYVQLETLPNHLCGLSRPVFFKGITTVVTKLFHIVKPHVAVFGEKDFQQLAIIRRMVKDLNMDIEIIGGTLIREADGLAMSSRNAYLSDDERTEALRLSQSLSKAREMITAGETQAAAIKAMTETHLSGCPDMTIDYISLCDPETLDEVETVTSPTLMALAVMLGKTRLIDNTVLVPQ
ncbi:pantoate--beta-alanine ligase [Desulfoluna butyratoxydans]|uniref:Pantothenate synthetase n=1 Tax=Desulfoluna butyratoxydans TaxID=231438 RepID=A0A4U8YUG1_9BACT|nr:pantoate--beta-alanine ligase [Desulfoluna butyratoxydans]VFQ45532.1 pantoate-beta-alanine ligase [Desulfoluna butyratoxydans]